MALPAKERCLAGLHHGAALGFGFGSRPCLLGWVVRAERKRSTKWFDAQAEEHLGAGSMVGPGQALEKFFSHCCIFRTQKVLK